MTLLQRGDMKQALVFTRTKHRANRLADYLIREGVKADRIHGNRSQGQRTAALAAFKAGRVPVLVATDIAARGIDVDALGHVVNFDVPLAPEDYIHRIGRTGRAEATGEAFTFVSPDEADRTRGHRARRRTQAAARDGAGFRLRGKAAGEARDSDRAAHCRDPRAQGGGTPAPRRERTASRRPSRRALALREARAGRASSRVSNPRHRVAAIRDARARANTCPTTIPGVRSAGSVRPGRRP